MFSHTDEFTTEADHFRSYGMYCKASQDSMSGQRYWVEQARRCIYGHKNSVGDSITGWHYFYLNFCPMEIVVKKEGVEIGDDGTVEAERPVDFPAHWDYDADFFRHIKEAQEARRHIACLKTRERGYSFKGSSLLLNNYYFIPNSRSFVYAFSDEFLTGDGILTKTWNTMSFIDHHTAWGKRRQKHDSMYHKRASRLITRPNGTQIEKGFMSEIIGVEIGRILRKARGKRGNLFLIEEAGSFPKLLQLYKIMRSCVERDGAVYGLILLWGTGGDTEGSLGLEKLFFEGEPYRIYQVPNVWSNKSQAGTCGFFVPVWTNRFGCMDKDGNTNREKAISEVMAERHELIQGSKNQAYVLEWLAEHPMTPEEALYRPSGSKYPVIELKERLSDIAVNRKRYEDAEYIGNLEFREGKVLWKDDPLLYPIREYPVLEKGNIDGATVIYEHPVLVEGQAMVNRYIAGADTADDDGAVASESLLSMFIFDLYTDKIVAEYTGRPRIVSQWFEQARRLLIYYSAVCNYERRNKGIYGYFYQKNCLYLLCEEPGILKTLDISGATTEGNNSKGTAPSQFVNSTSREWIVNWLLKPAYGYDDGSGILNLHTIRSVPLLQELIYWNKDDNFDRERALGMTMILREDRLRNLESTKKAQRMDDFANDKYFQQWSTKNEGRRLAFSNA